MAQLPDFANKGEQVKANLVLDSRVVRLEQDGSEIEIFNSGIQTLDWAAYNFARSAVETVKPTDTRVIDLGGASIYALYVETNAPIVLEFTQNSETRRLTVSPSVQPTDWFTSATRSPSEVPKNFQPGILNLTCDAISTLTIKGISTVKVLADVILGFAGYR